MRGSPAEAMDLAPRRHPTRDYLDFIPRSAGAGRCHAPGWVYAPRGAGTNPALPGYKFRKEPAMSLLKWALIMLAVSLLAALFGFTDLAAASADVARVLFYIFAVIFLVLLILGVMGARTVRGP
jgi:uncharacterized membrane protein YtjA (UPF0391 family)